MNQAAIIYCLQGIMTYRLMRWLGICHFTQSTGSPLALEGTNYGNALIFSSSKIFDSVSELQVTT